MKKIVAVLFSVLFIPTALFAESGFRIHPSSVVVVGTLAGDGSLLTNLPAGTETDPVFSTFPAHGINPGDISDWGMAYSWGNHAEAGYSLLGGTQTFTGLNTFPKLAIEAATPELSLSTSAPLHNGDFNFRVVGGVANAIVNNAYFSGGGFNHEKSGGSSWATFYTSNDGNGGDYYLFVSSAGPIDTPTNPVQILTVKAVSQFVGIKQTNPAYALDVNGGGYFASSVTASAFYGDGSNLTGLSSGDVFLASTQTFTGENTFTRPITVGKELITNVCGPAQTTCAASCSSGLAAMGGSCSTGLTVTPLDSTLGASDYTCTTSIGTTITAKVACARIN